MLTSTLLNKILLALVLVLFVILAFSWKSCNNKVDEEKYTKAIAEQNDLKNKVNEWQSAAAQEKANYNLQYANLQHAADSARQQIREKAAQLNYSNSVIEQLANENDSLAAKHDTIAQLKNCDTLASMVKEQISTINNLEGMIGSVNTTLEDQKKLDSIALAQKSSFNDSMRVALNAVTDNYNTVLKKNLALEKKQNRKFSFGVGGGVTYIAGKPQAVIMAGVMYNLFRF